ncbi:MAG: hypothetical protein MJY48_02370 [Bacteroidales bacterium]|nr:hypothetical protein [Bacteroidales bacterium]
MNAFIHWRGVPLQTSLGEFAYARPCRRMIHGCPFIGERDVALLEAGRWGRGEL